jgi:flagellar hook-basal body complex protein FliE
MKKTALFSGPRHALTPIFFLVHRLYVVHCVLMRSRGSRRRSRKAPARQKAGTRYRASIHDAEKKRLEAQLSEATKRTEETESIRAKLAAQLSEATKRAEEAESIRANLAAQLSEVTTRVVATNAKKAETAVQTATRRFESGARLSYCGRAQVFGDYTLKPFTQGVVVGPSSDGNPEYLAMQFPSKTDAVNIQVRYLNSPPRMNERNARSYTTR